jgi:aspartate ammonia-lyase
VMAAAADTFDRECVREIKARPERMAEFNRRSVGQAALLNEELGFMGAAKVATRAIEEERTVREIADEEGIPTKKLED